MGVAEQPERPRHQGEVSHSSILASRTSRQSFFLAACVECLDGPFKQFAGSAGMPHEKANHSLSANRIEKCGSITAGFGELKQGRDHFLGQRQFTTNDARGGQPEHDPEMLRGISEALAQLASASESRHRLVRRWPLGRDQARTKSEVEIKLQPVLSCAVGQMAPGLDASLRVCDGLKVGGAHGGLLAGLQPISHRLFEQSGLGEMVRESFGLSLYNFWEPLLEGVFDRGMQSCASAL